MALPHVLLISNFYYPEITGTAVYTTGLTEHLVGNGYRVSVLTGFPNYPHWRVFLAYRGRLWRKEVVRSATVFRRRFFIPRQGRAQTVVKRALYELGFILNGATAIPLIDTPDLVLGVVPNVGCGVLARMTARFYRVPYLLVFQDLTSAGARQTGIRGGQAVAPAIDKLERWMAQGAKRVGIVAEGFRKPIERMGVSPDAIIRLRNWPDVAAPTEPRSEARGRLGWDGKFVCLHAGNMGHKQGLENIIEAARLAQSRHKLHFVLMGDGNRRVALEEMAQQYELRNVEFLPVQSRESFPNILQAADVLVLSQRPDVSDMALPSKLTAYFKMGLPVVCVASSESEAARELVLSGAGRLVDPMKPNELVGVLMNLREDTALARQLGQAALNHATANLDCEEALSRWERMIATSLGHSSLSRTTLTQ